VSRADATDACYVAELAMLIALSSPRTYLIFGSFCFAMFFFVWFYIPETKGDFSPHIFALKLWTIADDGVGLSLEAMDELFGVTDETKHPLTGSALDTVRSKENPVTEVETARLPKETNV